MSQNQVSSCRVKITRKLNIFATVESLLKKIRITEDDILIIVQHIIQLFAHYIATSHAMSRSLVNLTEIGTS